MTSRNARLGEDKMTVDLSLLSSLLAERPDLTQLSSVPPEAMSVRWLSVRVVSGRESRGMRWRRAA